MQMLFWHSSLNLPSTTECYHNFVFTNDLFDRSNVSDSLHIHSNFVSLRVANSLGVRYEQQ